MLQIREDIRSERRQSSSRDPSDVLKLRVQVWIPASAASERGHQLPCGGEVMRHCLARADSQEDCQEICQVSSEYCAGINIYINVSNNTLHCCQGGG